MGAGGLAHVGFEGQKGGHRRVGVCRCHLRLRWAPAIRLVDRRVVGGQHRRDVTRNVARNSAGAAIPAGSSTAEVGLDDANKAKARGVTGAHGPPGRVSPLYL